MNTLLKTDKINTELNQIHNKLFTKDIDVIDLINIKPKLIKITQELDNIILNIKKDNKKDIIEDAVLRTLLFTTTISSLTKKEFLIPVFMILLKETQLLYKINKIDKPNTIKLLTIINKLIDNTNYYNELITIKEEKLLTINNEVYYKKELTEKEIDNCANSLILFAIYNPEFNEDIDIYLDFIESCNIKIQNKLFQILDNIYVNDKDYITKIKKLMNDSNNNKCIKKRL